MSAPEFTPQQLDAMTRIDKLRGLIHNTQGRVQDVEQRINRLTLQRDRLQSQLDNAICRMRALIDIIRGDL